MRRGSVPTSLTLAPSAQGAGVGVGTDGNHPPPGPLQSSS